MIIWTDPPPVQEPKPQVAMTACLICCQPRPIAELDERCPTCDYTMNVLAYCDEDIARILSEAETGNVPVAA